ncbi:hypothetical protein FEK29_02835 [Maribacter aurantiacus]|uniref:DUF3575 domain-containing protein n=2 Tax=Maribacter aurantiacus TaxID=1882343 RepID=A0A5R8MC93_9FLAO|nr:hypothetical protein FEK29_02835 [Maribacter aurantiacus]
MSLGFTSSIMGQAYPRFENNHEIKFNIGQFLATSTVEGLYEFFFTEDTSIGGTLYFNGDATDYNGNFGIGPNLRAYFGYIPRSGFFAEVFGLYYTGENDVDSTTLGARNNDYGTTAIGLGIGNKWVTRSDRFTLEIHGGMGRNINPEVFQNAFMFRGGLSIGFRF